MHGARYPEDVELYDHVSDPDETRNVAVLFTEEVKWLFEEARALMLKADDELKVRQSNGTYSTTDH